MRGKRVLQDKTGHSDPVKMRTAGFLRFVHQPVMQIGKCLLSVIIIRIDDTERLMYDFSAGKNGLTGSPRFLSHRRAGITGRKIFLFLKNVSRIDVFFNSASDYFPEVLFQVFPDYKNNPVEAGTHSIVN